MTKRTPIVLALASLALTSVACDADSPDDPTILMAADVIDREDAEVLADEDEGLEPLVEAVELTADVEPTESFEVALIEYCWGIGAGASYDYAGQCIGLSQMFVPDWCIVADPYHPALGYAVSCVSY